MSSLFTFLGGLGLFLIGMQVLTDGLKSLAGEALRKLLVRFTQSPFSGAVTGAIATGILQSSSATTVAAVGFVGAGLLTFNQALGIIFGANIGTTMTGWIVALVGFKLDLGMVALPLLLPDFWLSGILGRSLIYGIVALSITFLASYGGFISLAQTMLAGIAAPRNMGDEYVAEFERMYAEIAAEHDAILYPNFLEGIPISAETVLPDGIHPTRKGVAIIVEGILPKVEELIERAAAARG